LNVLLVVTHLVAFFAGIIAAYVWILWSFGVREADKDHVTLEIHHHPSGGSTAVPTTPDKLRTVWPAVALLVASAVVIAIGLQAYVASRNDSESRARDRAIVKCVREFSNQIAQVYAVRADASQMLEDATKQKSDAQDEVFFATIRLRANKFDPVASANFDEALANFRAAARHRDRVAARVARIRDRNPPPNPAKAVCDG
jgi:Spy/CpxP family protein refolding chaperone